MKLFKSLFIVLCISFVLASGTVLAAYHGFLDIRLPRLSGHYTFPHEKTRTTGTYQQVWNQDAVDSVTGKGRAVQGRVGLKTGSKTYLSGNWKKIAKGSTVDMGDSNQSGTFRLQFMASTSTLIAEVRFWGGWYY